MQRKGNKGKNKKISQIENRKAILNFDMLCLHSCERGDITKDSTNNKRIINRYYEQLHANRFNNLDEMTLNKLHNSDEIGNLNSPISIK